MTRRVCPCMCANRQFQDLASRLGDGYKKEKHRQQRPPGKPESSLSERLGARPSRDRKPSDEPMKKGVSFDSFIKRDKAEAEKKRTGQKMSSKSPQPQSPANSLGARLGSGSKTRSDSRSSKSKSRSPTRSSLPQKPSTTSKPRSPPRGLAAQPNRSSSKSKSPPHAPKRRDDTRSSSSRGNSRAPDPDRYYRGAAYGNSDNYYRPSQSASRFRSGHHTSSPAPASHGPTTSHYSSSQYGVSNDMYDYAGHAAPRPKTNTTTYDTTATRNKNYHVADYSAPPQPPQPPPPPPSQPQPQLQPGKHGRDESVEAPETTKRRRLKIRGVGTPTTVKITYLDVDTTEGDLREILRQLGFENITSCTVSPVYDELEPKYSTATVGFKNREDASACVKELDGVEADDSGSPLVAEIVEPEPAQPSQQETQPSSLLDQLIKHRMAKVEQDNDVKYIKGRGFH